MAKYLWYLANSYVATLALLHIVLRLTVYPYCVNTLANLSLMPWDESSVQKDKLLSIIVYVAICLLTPLMALLLVHWQKRLQPALLKVPYSRLALLTVWSVGCLGLSQYGAKNNLSSLGFLFMTLLCWGANGFCVRVNYWKTCIHEK